MQIYSLLHFQLSLNKFRVKSCLIVTDGASSLGLMEAFLAIQMLEKTIGLSNSSICCCTDNYNV